MPSSGADIPSIREPTGLNRSDGKRSDGLTLVPWTRGRSLTWDVTVTDTLAASNLHGTVHSSGAAAAAIAAAKTRKYSEIAVTHHFVPLAFETLGPICSEGRDFIQELGRRLAAKTDDPRETSFLMQRLSIEVQRGNATSIRATFNHILSASD